MTCSKRVGVLPANAPGGRCWLMPPAWTLALLVLATAVSLATTEYSFCGGDATGQLVMVLHSLNPMLLNHDPLITDVGIHYRNATILFLAWLARMTSLPTAYVTTFVAARFLLICAFYALARSFTCGRTIAVIGVFILTGFGYLSLGCYLGGVNLVEGNLVPRVLALPFALFALSATIKSRYSHASLWLTITLFLHPVTGLNAAGLYVVYSLLGFRELRAMRFLVSLALPLAAIVAVFLWTHQDGVAAWQMDPRWREIVLRTNGRYLLVTMDIARKRFLAASVEAVAAKNRKRSFHCGCGPDVRSAAAVRKVSDVEVHCGPDSN